jgi:hypothetical protein
MLAAQSAGAGYRTGDEAQVRQVSMGITANKELTATGLTRLHRVPNQLK